MGAWNASFQTLSLRSDVSATWSTWQRTDVSRLWKPRSRAANGTDRQALLFPSWKLSLSLQMASKLALGLTKRLG